MSDDDPKPVGHARWFEQLPDEHSFYNMVGRVASEWAHFEHVLDLAIWELLSWKTAGLTEAMMASVTSQILGVRPRVNAISALAKARGLNDNVIKPFRKLAQDSFSA